MKGHIRKISFLIGTVAIALIAASYRFPDMAKAKGVLKIGGSEAKPVVFQASLKQYALITDISVASSVKGDVKIELQGNPPIPHQIYNMKSPVIDLGLSHFYRLDGNILKGVKSGEKPILLRILLYPPPLDPVCGMPREEGFLSKRYGWKTYYFCSKTCLDEFNKSPEKYRDKDGFKGGYALIFYDAKTDDNLLKIPITFCGQEKKGAMIEGHVH